MMLLNVFKTIRQKMYLVDTNVISELRRGAKSNQGVRYFFESCITHNHTLYLSVITIGELKRGVEIIRHRNDLVQAKLLDHWLNEITTQYSSYILPVSIEISNIWASLRVPLPHNALDKLIAATAIHHNLTVVTRNEKDFSGLPLQVLNPFS